MEMFCHFKFCHNRRNQFCFAPDLLDSYLSNFKMTIFGTKAPSGGHFFNGSVISTLFSIQLKIFKRKLGNVLGTFPKFIFVSKKMMMQFWNVHTCIQFSSVYENNQYFRRLSCSSNLLRRVSEVISQLRIMWTSVSLLLIF